MKYLPTALNFRVNRYYIRIQLKDDIVTVPIETALLIPFIANKLKENKRVHREAIMEAYDNEQEIIHLLSLLNS